MKNLRTKCDKKIAEKYEHIVKKHIDELDLIDVFPDAPENHYAPIIRDITVRLYRCKTFLDIAETIFIVMAF